MWTFFGYADDDDGDDARVGCGRRTSWARRARVDRRQRGDATRPARGDCRIPTPTAFVEMGGTDTERADHIVTESAIRAFYAYYREVMEL